VCVCVCNYNCVLKSNFEVYRQEKYVSIWQTRNRRRWIGRRVSDYHVAIYVTPKKMPSKLGRKRRESADNSGSYVTIVQGGSGRGN